jgi:hypothetical protein
MTRSIHRQSRCNRAAIAQQSRTQTSYALAGQTGAKRAKTSKATRHRHRWIAARFLPRVVRKMADSALLLTLPAAVEIAGGTA